MALAPPRALGPPLVAAVLKARPEDFEVEEQLSFTPSGSGPHWLLRVEKRGANTRWVAAQLARLCGVPPADVGYAGLKDRHARTVQWFSVPARGRPASEWCALDAGEYRVLEAVGNDRKLRRGALAGNRFRIRLRGAAWPREQLAARLDALRVRGAPNYFGPQRFGRDAANLARVAAWIEHGRQPSSRTERVFALSAARALIFNALLARRVDDGTWCELAPGDRAGLDGSASHFLVESLDDTLRARLAAFDLHPTGPLWGRGDPAAAGAVQAAEIAIGARYAKVAELLAQAGLDQERRPLRCAVRDLAVSFEPEALCLEFRLGRGQFATAVLAELADCGLPEDLDAED